MIFLFPLCHMVQRVWALDFSCETGRRTTVGLQKVKKFCLLVSLLTSSSHTDIAPSAHRQFAIWGLWPSALLSLHISLGAPPVFVGNSQICFQVRFTHASMSLFPTISWTFLECLTIPSYLSVSTSTQYFHSCLWPHGQNIHLPSVICLRTLQVDWCAASTLDEDYKPKLQSPRAFGRVDLAGVPVSSWQTLGLQKTNGCFQQVWGRWGLG